MGARWYKFARVIILGSGLAGTSLALAGEADNQGVLVLGVLQEGLLEVRATRAVVQRLGRMGEEVVEARWRLTAAEQSCRERECLVQVGQRHRAGRVLFGEVTPGGVRTYVVRMWLFDIKARQSVEEEQSCEDCDRALLASTASTMAGRLLEHSAAARQTGPVVTVMPDDGRSGGGLDSRLDAQAVAVKDGAAAKPFYKRGWFWGVLGGLVAGAAATGIAVGTTLPSSSIELRPGIPRERIFFLK